MRDTLQKQIDGRLCKPIEEPFSSYNAGEIGHDFEELCERFKALLPKLPAKLPKPAPTLEQLGFVVPNISKKWDKAHQLALTLYHVTASCPHDETYGLTSQIRRAASSIPSNIVEGCGREGHAELSRFCTIARGSASELEYQRHIPPTYIVTWQPHCRVNVTDSAYSRRETR